MNNFHKGAIALLVIIAIGTFRFVSVADNKIKQNNEQSQAVFLRDSDEFSAACKFLSGTISVANKNTTITCMNGDEDITNSVELKLWRLSEDYGKDEVLGKLTISTGATTDSGVTKSGEPTSPFDSYEPMPRLTESVTNYNSGTLSFSDPWKSATIENKDGTKSTLFYAYCDIIGAQIDAVKKAGLSWKDVYVGIIGMKNGVPSIPVVSGGEIDISHDTDEYSGFSFRKADNRACYVTFTRQTMDCLNHAYDACHTTLMIEDDAAEFVGKNLKEYLDSIANAKSNDKLVRENSEIVKDAIREFDYNGEKTKK